MEIGREIHVSLDLTTIDPPEVNPPPGIRIVTWAERPELIRGIYEVAVEASADIPGDEEDEIEPFEDWLAHEMQAGPGDRPEATFVAVAGDVVVGYSKFSVSPESTVAHHDLTGVKRAWRKRGIARALKQAQIAWAKQNGYERLGHDERGAERADPPPQCRARVPAVRLPDPLPRPLEQLAVPDVLVPVRHERGSSRSR